MSVEIVPEDDTRILGSGSVIAFHNKPVKLRIISPLDANESPFFLVFRFEHDETVEGNRINTIPDIEEGSVTLVLTNYTHALGTGTNEPQALASSPLSDLYVHFRVYGFNEEIGDKLLFYTIYEVVKKQPKLGGESKSNKKTTKSKKLKK